jgi:hypothetical protein
MMEDEQWDMKAAKIKGNEIKFALLSFDQNGLPSQYIRASLHTETI